MARCPTCDRQDLVRVPYGNDWLLLEPSYHCYVAIQPAHIFPVDGDQVALCAALVEHAPLCAGTRRQQAEDRQRGRQQYEARHQGRR